MKVELLTEETSSFDARDLVVEGITHPELQVPTVVDYRPEMPPVWDQGVDGPCSSYTAAAIKSWQELKDYGLNKNLSRYFLYNIRPNKPTKGMTPRMTMQLLRAYGIPTHDSYRRFGRKGLAKLPKWLLTEAQNHRIAGYARVMTIEGLQKSLYKNGPAYAAMPVFNDSDRFWHAPHGQKMLGGHAVAIVGYNSEGFIIRNSWGQSWADKGHTVYPYSDWGAHFEIWTIIDEKSGELLPAPPKERSAIGKLLAKIFGSKNK